MKTSTAVPRQHLHFRAIGNLVKLLAEHGFGVVGRERGEAQVLGGDSAWAVSSVLRGGDVIEAGDGEVRP